MYKLRAELRSHEADVRGVAVSPEGIIATASRDRTVALWDMDGLEPRVMLRGHSHFVNDLTFVASGKLVTASSDMSLRVWDVNTGECVMVLSGHSNTVCAVATLPGAGTERVISSSWDKTARVWDVESGMCLRVLSGHEAAVWSALGLPDGRMVTVSADKTVRLWPSDGSGTSSALPTSHKDVIRDVVVGPKGGFITVANDSALIYWRDTGGSYVEAQRLSDLHDGSYTYSVDSIEMSPGKWVFVTGGEDNSVRIAEADFLSGTDITAIQAIMHPGTVWGACLCPGGDIVSACSDGVARIFTKDATALADPDVLAAFEKAVSERQVNTKVIGGVDVSKLPDSETALTTPGKKDGENRIVKTAGGKAEVHMWSAAEEKWSKVGDVVDGPGGSASLGTGEVKGKTYDFVFEVEIGEGGAKEKLGYNRGENPYLAAQRFIDDNELSQEFLDQIAQFIEQQVPPDALQASSQGPSDPLTGGSRYVPKSQSQVSSSRGDPLTGGSRYVPGGSNVPDGSLPPPRKLIPHKDGVISYKNSDQLEKIQQKLSQFNADFAEAGSEKALSQEEATVFGSSLIPKLKVRGGTMVVLDDKDCAVIERLLKWPTSHVFPVLDIGRLVISIPSGGAYFFGTRNGEVLGDVLGYLSSSNATAPVYIMGCRFLCNMFANRVSGAAARQHCEKILAAASGAAKCENRRARETYASLLINYAVMLHDTKGTPDERSPIIRATVERILGGERDVEVLYRLMIAMGTLLCDDIESAKRGVELGVATAAAEAAPLSPRLQQIATEIATIIAS